MKYGLINRHILMEQLQKKCMDSDTVDFHRGLLEAQAIVMKLPDENDRPEGKWITVHYAREELNCPEKSMLDFVKCPFCETIHQGRHNFCSRCGAKMEAEND